MVKMKKISVIVPVYNVEEYICQCVDSILEQTYTALEVILVDDGSTDKCPTICDAYAGKDTRVKVIHKVNGGLADARNAGIDVATGEFIAFVDSDDYIEPDMYEVLAENIEMYHADIAIAKWHYDDCDAKTLQEDEKICFDREQGLDFLIKGNGTYTITMSVWDRLYRRELIDGIYFPKGKCYEDIVWSTKVFWRAKKSVYVDKALYVYRKRQGSITQIDQGSRGAISPRLVSDRIPLLEEQVTYLKSIERSELAEECQFRLYELMLVYYSMGRYNIKNKMLCRDLRQRIADNRNWAKAYLGKTTDKRRKLILWLSVHTNGLFSLGYGLWLNWKYRNKQMDA